jgi:glutamate synthase domain-containing protein 2
MKKHFRVFFQISSAIFIVIMVWAAFRIGELWWIIALLLPVTVIGWYDSLQHKDNISKNYPVLGAFKKAYTAERHTIVQEFLESNTEGKPFSWQQRKIVYARAEGTLLSTPFGTELDFSMPGSEWCLHTISPIPVLQEDLRINIGSKDCLKPYDASILNVSGMSYGSISRNAIMALGQGAKAGNFALNTGEGGLTQWHLIPGCDLVFQFGTGYFGCRNKEGNFDHGRFKELAGLPEVKMIEVKISQGAKPGYGAILPASKNTEEIAKIRGLIPYTTIYSPGAHTAFSSPIGLLEFVKELRELSGGKPVGFKLCIGYEHEFVAICKAMLETGIRPDYIVIDGSEGGTGAANLDSINYVGMPVELALAFAHDTLVGFNLRKDIKLIGSGKVISSFDIIKFLALGADSVNSARAMMFALGCAQAMKCNTNECPTGVTSMEPDLVRGLVVKDKKVKVANFHKNTIEGIKELIAASGFRGLDQLKRSNIYRRTGPEKVVTLENIYPSLKVGELLQEPYPERFNDLMKMANASTFQKMI